MKNENLDISLDLTILKSEVKYLINEAKDNYEKMLLKRAYSNMQATECLINENHLIDVPVLLRVSFELFSRNYLYKKNPNEIFENNLNALKFMGKGPSPNKLFNYLGDEVRMVYEMYCSFSHPDLMSLILNNDIKEENRILTNVIISLGIITNTLVLISTYPESRINTEELFEKALRIVNYVTNSFIQLLNINDVQNLMNIKDSHPLLGKPFKREELNAELFSFMNLILSEGTETGKEFLQNKYKDLIILKEEN